MHHRYCAAASAALALSDEAEQGRELWHQVLEQMGGEHTWQQRLRHDNVFAAVWLCPFGHRAVQKHPGGLNLVVLDKDLAFECVCVFYHLMMCR